MSANSLAKEFEAGVKGQKDIDLADVVHHMFSDINHSWVLALQTAGVPNKTIESCKDTVLDYIVNHYGDL